MPLRKSVPIGHCYAWCGHLISRGTNLRLPVTDTPVSPERRSMLKAALAAGGLGLPLVAAATALAVDATEQQKNARPKEGDLFVFVSGDRQGQVITPADVPAGSRPMIA